MINLEQQLIDHGFSPEDVTTIVDLVETRNAEEARAQAAQLLHVIFLRVERDSAAGCALRRALGFSSEASLARAAKAFCVEKQYLHSLHLELEDKLGDLSFLSVQARAAAKAAGKSAGPPGESPTHR